MNYVIEMWGLFLGESSVDTVMANVTITSKHVTGVKVTNLHVLLVISLVDKYPLKIFMENEAICRLNNTLHLFHLVSVKKHYTPQK